MSVIICDLVFNKAVLRPWVLSARHFFQWVFGIPLLADYENSSLKCTYGGRRSRKMGRAISSPGIRGKLIPSGKCLTFAFLSCFPPSAALLQSQGKTWEAHINGRSLWLDVQDSSHATELLYDCRQIIWALAFSSIRWDDYNNDNNWLFITCTICQALF